MHATDSMQMLQHNGYLAARELEAGLRLDNTGTPDYTIGYEAEILGNAIFETGTARALGLSRPCDDQPVIDHIVSKNRHRFADTGFTAAHDGHYEIQSPVAWHPKSLYLATVGIVRAGILPRRAKSVVTSHISIGFGRNELENPDEKIPNFLRILRVAEQLGGTTVGRLMAACDPHSRTHRVLPERSWAQKGFGGVYVQDAGLTEEEKTWLGGNHRVEFRTLRYRNPQQLAVALEALYFLTRASLAQDNPLAELYRSFENRFREYTEANGLPGYDDVTLETILTPPNELDSEVIGIHRYAEHMKQSPQSELKVTAVRAIIDIKEELGMSGHPTSIAKRQPALPLFAQV